jgi:hypothetical protein
MFYAHEEYRLNGFADYLIVGFMPLVTEIPRRPFLPHA